MSGGAKTSLSGVSKGAKASSTPVIAGRRSVLLGRPASPLTPALSPSEGAREGSGARPTLLSNSSRHSQLPNSSRTTLFGFTLIELLAVIAIIGLLAGLVMGLSGVATEKSRRSRMTGELNRLVTAIDAYKLEIGTYPPDNAKIPALTEQLRADGTPNPDFYTRAGMNTLFYELAGATFANTGGGEFTTLHAQETVAASDLTANFGIKGVQNSARDKKNVPYRGIGFKPSSYAQLDVSGNVHILVTPLKGPYDKLFMIKKGNMGANPWFYNLTGTNKHNPDGYDLWTEYLAGRKTNVIGNWKE